jgi:hypothetical protein
VTQNNHIIVSLNPGHTLPKLLSLAQDRSDDNEIEVLQKNTKTHKVSVKMLMKLTPGIFVLRYVSK